MSDELTLNQRVSRCNILTWETVCGWDTFAWLFPGEAADLLAFRRMPACDMPAPHTLRFARKDANAPILAWRTGDAHGPTWQHQTTGLTWKRVA